MSEPIHTAMKTAFADITDELAEIRRTVSKMDEAVAEIIERKKMYCQSNETRMGRLTAIRSFAASLLNALASGKRYAVLVYDSDLIKHALMAAVSGQTADVQDDPIGVFQTRIALSSAIKTHVSTKVRICNGVLWVRYNSTRYTTKDEHRDFLFDDITTFVIDGKPDAVDLDAVDIVDGEAIDEIVSNELAMYPASPSEYVTTTRLISRVPTLTGQSVEMRDTFNFPLNVLVLEKI